MKKLLLLVLLTTVFSSCELGTTAPATLFDCDVLYTDHSKSIPSHSSIFVEKLLLESGRVVYDTTIVNNSDSIMIIADPTDFKNSATECPEKIETRNYFAVDFTEKTILVSVEKSDFDSKQSIIDKMVVVGIITENELSTQNWQFSEIQASIFNKANKKIESTDANNITYIIVNK